MPGTKKILIFDAAAVTDWSQLPRGTRIKIREHFTPRGKEMEHLVEDAIQFAARLA